MSLNYSWLAKTAPILAGEKGNILDFGCGVGTALELVSQANPDMTAQGADTFEGHYENWLELVPKGLEGQIVKINDGKLPFPDDHFDCVYANQVFEHVFKPEVPVSEIYRVLKPGGQFLALFPCKGTFYEGHVGVYFAHWFMGQPKLLRNWLSINHRCGAGLYRGKQTREEWVEHKATILETACIYHSWHEFRDLLKSHFATEPVALEHDNIAHRLEHTSLRFLSNSTFKFPMKQLAILIHRLRGGRIFSIKKPLNSETAG